MLDVGTNNEELLEDEDYLGLKHKRLEGDEYYDMVDEFMKVRRGILKFLLSRARGRGAGAGGQG